MNILSILQKYFYMYWPNRIKLTEYVFIYNYSTYYMCTINVNKITKRITMRLYYLIK